MSTPTNPIEDPLYKVEAKERYEMVVGEGAKAIARNPGSPELTDTLIKVLGGKAAYLAHNLIEIAGYPEAEAVLDGWKSVWSELGKIMLGVDDDPTYEVATVIDRASSRLFPCEYDEEGMPGSPALVEFYRRFASNIDSPSVHLTAAWLNS